MEKREQEGQQGSWQRLHSASRPQEARGHRSGWGAGPRKRDPRKRDPRKQEGTAGGGQAPRSGTPGSGTPGSKRASLGGVAGPKKRDPRKWDPRKRDPRKQEGATWGGCRPQEAGPQEARGHRWGAVRAPRSGTPGSKTEPLAGGHGPIVWSPKGLGPESERSPFEGFPGDPVCQAPCGRQPGDPGRDGCPHHLSWGGGGCRGVSVPRPTGPQWVGGSLSPGPARWTEEGERQQEEGCPGPWGL